MANLIFIWSHKLASRSEVGHGVPPPRSKPPRQTVHLSHEELELAASGLKFRNPIYRLAWWVLHPREADVVKPAGGIFVWLVDSGLAALEQEMRRRLAAPDLGEDDEVFLMNDLRGVELAREHLNR